mgnify:CR=1 FL=1
MSKPSLSLVLPCFNEEENIARTVRVTLAWFDAAGIDGEAVVVDDGSRDKTPAILEELKKEDPRVVVIRHEKNRGYGGAVKTGCDAGTKEVLGFRDSDGRFKREDLDLLLPAIADVPFVTGGRRKRADSFVRNVFGKVLGMFNFAVFGLWVRDVNCGLKIFRREIWPKIRPQHGYEKLFNTEMFLRLKDQGIPWKQIDVPHYPRTAGQPTGAKPGVILRMFEEMWMLRRARGRGLRS